jgi:hypothetical protein
VLRAAARVGLSVAGSAAVSAGVARLHVLVAATAVRRIDLDPNQSLFHAAMVVRMLTTPVSCHAGAPRPAPPRPEVPSRPRRALLHCPCMALPEIFAGVVVISDAQSGYPTLGREAKEGGRPEAAGYWVTLRITRAVSLAVRARRQR